MAARRLVTIAMVAGTPVLTPGCARAVPSTGLDAAIRDQAEVHGPAVSAGLARVRAATAPFAELDAAVAAGYARDVAECYADPHHGAMGFHHLRRDLVDARVDLERPEILLYERKAGRSVLNGVEYIVPYTRWPRDSVPPTVMGQPLKRSDVLGLWYLHLWAWTRNPAGLFADWNPAVRCPADAVPRTLPSTPSPAPGPT